MFLQSNLDKIDALPLVGINFTLSSDQLLERTLLSTHSNESLKTNKKLIAISFLIE